MNHSFTKTTLIVLVTLSLSGFTAHAQTNSANTKLSNLKSPTAVNQSLIPGVNNSVSLGSSSIRWKDVNLFNLKFSDGTTQTTASPWGSNGTSVFYNGGNVGIGNSSPLIGGLVVDTKVGNTHAIFGSNTDGISIASVPDRPSVGFNAYNNFVPNLSSDQWLNLSTGFAGVIQLNSISGELEFQTSAFSGVVDDLSVPLLRMIIEPNGFVGIGTPTPNAQLTIGDPVDNEGIFMDKTGLNPGMEIIKESTLSGTAALYVTNNGSADALDVFANTSNGIVSSTNNASAWAGFFSGNVFTTGTYQGSDEKLKQNIRDFTSAMDIINELHPKLYDFKHDGNYAFMNLPQGDHYGLIAEDVQKVLPNLVKETTFDTRLAKPGKHTEESSPAETVDFKALNYTELIPIMIKGIQEQQQTIDQQQQTIQQQQHSIGDLQQQINDLKLAVSQQSSTDNSLGNAGAIQPLNGHSTGSLDQNIPNPFSSNTTIHYHLPDNQSSAQLVITDVAGVFVKSFVINASSNGQITIHAGELPAGTYVYSLIIDGQKMDSKQMTLTK